MKQSTWTVRNKTPFTLIELLVVVAIIAILASMLLPALRSARERAYRAQCLHQQRQINLATFQYTDDWDNFLPARDGKLLQKWSGIHSQLTGAFAMINQGYLPADPIMLVCPSKDNPVRWIGVRDDLNNRYWDQKLWRQGYSTYSYPMGSAPFADLDDNHSKPWIYWVRRDRLDNDFVCFADPVIFPEWTNSFPWLKQTNHWDIDGPTGGNAVFNDGHGEWITFGSGRWKRGDISCEIRWPGGTPLIGYYNLRRTDKKSHWYFFGSNGFDKPSRGSCWRP